MVETSYKPLPGRRPHLLRRREPSRQHARIMLQTATQQLARGGRSGSLQQCLKASYVRCYSSALQSTIKLSSLQAPHSGEIAVLSLNRPKSRNAISKQLLGELNRVVEQLHSEGAKSSTRALILASESDDAFCAGADLKERLTFSEEEYAASNDIYEPHS